MIILFFIKFQIAIAVQASDVVILRIAPAYRFLDFPLWSRLWYLKKLFQNTKSRYYKWYFHKKWEWFFYLWVNKYISQPWNSFRSAGFRFRCSFSNSAVNFVDNIPRFFPWLWDSIKTGYPKIIFLIRNLVIVPW